MNWSERTIQLLADLTKLIGVQINQTEQDVIPEIVSTRTTLNNTLTQMRNALEEDIENMLPYEADNLDITYIAAGNGAGEIGTVVYKKGVVVVKTVTLTYDASNRLIGVATA